MDDNSNSILLDDDSLKIIFIGNHLSTSEIHIEKLPTLDDVYYHSCKKNAVNEHQNFYQYINLYYNKIINFHYDDGIRKNSGMISLHKSYLQITMDQPSLAVCNYFLIQRGNKVSFLTCPPYSKIKLEYKDTSMICAEKLATPPACKVKGTN